jgi:hypothetical protein
MGISPRVGKLPKVGMNDPLGLEDTVPSAHSTGTDMPVPPSRLDNILIHGHQVESSVKPCFSGKIIALLWTPLKGHKSMTPKEPVIQNI